MDKLQILPIGSLGYDFIDGADVPQGCDEYYLRNVQSDKAPDAWRRLKYDEIEALVNNANTADNWDNILVTDEFNPQQVRGCEFYGLVRIGRLEELYLRYHDLSVPVGLTHSRIVSCDIGDDVAIHDVQYLAHYIVGDNVILLNIDEMHTTNHAKFGNGIIKDGEDEDVRVWIDLINEAGGRRVMGFDGMTPGDAYLWAKYRDDDALLQRLAAITQKTFDSRRGFYGSVGKQCVVKNCRIIKDANIGPYAYIKGANKLKNMTVNSSEDQPTQIGEGVELVNGIVGLGCHVFYGCKAVRFVMGDNSSLKYGARLIHSYLGDNSTVSCCELLNNLIFPAHEQHHNNSFLIASLVMGQSNLAASANIGSNHNSRAPDGEIQAGRGFWPGLGVSVKHNCRFASFILLTSGTYSSEMDISLPFSLVSNDVAHNRLTVLPAYWWLYNMYALARNNWKFHTRDKRKRKVQNIEFDSLAPDSIEEIFAATALLAEWTGKAALRDRGELTDDDAPPDLTAAGRAVLLSPAQKADELEVLGENMERSGRKTVILKARAAWNAYREMLHHYAVSNLLAYLEENPDASLPDMRDALAGQRQRRWVNLGGQIVLADDLAQLTEQIKSGRLDCWSDIHAAYDELWRKYPLDKQRHALATLVELVGPLTSDTWNAALDEALRIQEYIAEQTYRTRKKDYDNPFRQITFDTTGEMRAVLGPIEENSFIKHVRRQRQEFAAAVESVRQRD